MDLTPPEQRPYVGSSSFNTVTDLIVGWNGVGRIVGSDEDVGDPGPLRLLNAQLGGQIGWLLGLAVVGLVAASWHSWQGRPHLPLSRREDQALLLWGVWLVSLVMFFSVAGDWDPHYLAMLSPAVAALVGVGLVTLWDDYRSPARCGWLMPLTLVATAGIQLHILAHYPEWSRWLGPTIVILNLGAAASLVVARLAPQLKGGGLPLGAISLGVGSLLLAPTIWAVSTVWYGAETRSPTAGPQAKPSETSNRFGSEGSEVDPLVENLEANQGDTEYLVAAIRSRIASPIILNTDEPVIALGGFAGRDLVFSIERVAGLVHQGPVRFFIIKERDIEHAAQPGTDRRYLELDEQVPPLQQLPRLKAHLKALADIHEKKQVRWITDNCEQVPEGLWQSSTSKSPTSTVLLYDCGTRSR